MKKTILLSVFYLLSAHTCFGQVCNTQAANKPSTLVRGMDDFMGVVSSNQKPKSRDITKIKPHLALAESWIKNILTGFTGAKLLYSNEYYLDPLDFTNLPEDAMSGSFTKQFHWATGIKGSNCCKMRFFPGSIAGGDIAKIEAGASVKDFIKIGVNNSTGKWKVRDVGVKSSISFEGKGIVGSSEEINVSEVTVAVNEGVQVG